MRTLRWGKIDKTRYSSLKYRMQVPSDVVAESLHGVVELSTLSRYALITLFVKCSEKFISLKFRGKFLNILIESKKCFIDRISSI